MVWHQVSRILKKRGGNEGDGISMWLNAAVLDESMMYCFNFGMLFRIGAKGTFVDSTDNTVPPLFRISYRGTGSHKDSMSIDPCMRAENAEIDDID